MGSSPSSLSTSERSIDLRGRILAIDYGRRRIGLAVSDELGLTARPLETIQRTNRASDLRHLREVVQKHEVRRIIVGHPLRLDGTAGAMAAATAQFAASLRETLGLPVELVDERLSSWQAREMLVGRSHLRARQSTRHKKPGGAGRRTGQQRGHAARRGERRAAKSRQERASGVVDKFAASIFLRDYLEQLRVSGSREAKEAIRGTES